MRYIISLILLLLFASLCQAQDDFLVGKADGQSMATPNNIYVLSGLAFGCLSVGYSAIHNPDAPATALIGKSEAYIAGFKEGYIRKQKEINVSYSCFGWAMWAGFYIFYILTK